MAKSIRTLLDEFYHEANQCKECSSPDYWKNHQYEPTLDKYSEKFKKLIKSK